MHVLYTNFHPGDGGGHTTYIAGLIRGLRDHHRLTLAAPAGGRLNRIARDCGIEVADFDFPGGLRPRAIWRSAIRLARFFEGQSVDLVHVNGSRDHWIVVWASLLCRGPRPAIVWTKHNSNRIKRDPPNWLRARFFADHAIAVCRSVARQIEASVYAANGVTTIGLGIDTDHFTPSVGRESRGPLRAQWGAREEDLVVGSVAGTAQYKSWTTMAEALALLSTAERQHLVAVVAGEPPGDMEKAFVAQLGVSDRMVFPGMATDVRPLVGAFDVGFVLSRSIEAGSYAHREMMAMGRPVLASDFAGLPENLCEGIDGWIVPAGNPQAVADWLRRLLARSFDLAEMGRMARRHAEDSFALPLSLRETAAVYERVLRARTLGR